jgi:hypothetical protein
MSSLIDGSTLSFVTILLSQSAPLPKFLIAKRVSDSVSPNRPHLIAGRNNGHGQSDESQKARGLIESDRRRGKLIFDWPLINRLSREGQIAASGLAIIHSSLILLKSATIGFLYRVEVLCEFFHLIRHGPRRFFVDELLGILSRNSGS